MRCALITQDGTAIQQKAGVSWHMAAIEPGTHQLAVQMPPFDNQHLNELFNVHAVNNRLENQHKKGYNVHFRHRKKQLCNEKASVLWRGSNPRLIDWQSSMLLLDYSTLSYVT